MATTPLALLITAVSDSGSGGESRAAWQFIQADAASRRGLIQALGLTPIFTRAVIAFLALPGVVAFLVPVAWARLSRLPLHWPVGLALVVLGTVGLLWCIRDFYVSGKGTLAPWAPPQNLVVVGLYRYSRNPMYVAVAVILLGWAVVFRSAGLLVYALAVVVAFHLRIRLGEEPRLAQRHGAAWQHYTHRVRRWF